MKSQFLSALVALLAVTGGAFAAGAQEATGSQDLAGTQAAGWVNPSGVVTQANLDQEALPQVEEGTQWNPVRIHTEAESRPNDFRYEAKAEYVTSDGFMSGVEHVRTTGEFEGETLTDTYEGTYSESRSEVWVGVHGASNDGGTRWSVNGFGRHLTHSDEGTGAAIDGSYDYSWENSDSMTQVGVRGRVEHDVVDDGAQVLTVHGEAEVAVGDGVAHDLNVGANYRTARTEAYAEVGHGNEGAYANGNARYFLTSSDSSTRPYVYGAAESGAGYENLQVGGGVHQRLGDSGYGDLRAGYNTGSAGDGLAVRAQLGVQF